MKRRYFLIGLVITSILFITIIYSNSLINEEREEAVVERMNSLVHEYEDMQTLLFMSEFYGEEASCVALENMLSSMNKGLWDLGIKIDLYRQVTENFMKDPFYIEQKKEFNRKEVLYFSMLNKMKTMCSINQTIVSYFYKKKEDCPDCDAQSFVLSDIKHDLEKMKKDDELAIFSFDADMDMPSVSLLVRVYNITSYPSIVIGNKVYSGLHDKKETLNMICKESHISVCK